MKSTKLTLLALGCGTIFALMTTTGCNNQPASPAGTTSGSSTPGFNNKIPEKTMMRYRGNPSR